LLLLIHHWLLDLDHHLLLLQLTMLVVRLALMLLGLLLRQFGRDGAVNAVHARGVAEALLFGRDLVNEPLLPVDVVAGVVLRRIVVLFN
jgi:hypothetical protein